MGKEERANKEQSQVGKYNVCITLLFMKPDGNMVVEPINCKTWMHAGQFLALTLFDGTLRIVCLEQYHGFNVNLLSEEALGNLN